MSGGVAYVYGDRDELRINCNLETVELENVEDDSDITELKRLIEDHQRHTGSTVASTILDSWSESLIRFTKVMPTDYKRALAQMAKAEPVAIT